MARELRSSLSTLAEPAAPARPTAQPVVRARGLSRAFGDDLKSLWQRHRPAVLLVTHDVDEALALADRALVLRAGRISYATPISAPRPRDRAAPELARLRTRLLAELRANTEGTT